MTPLVLDPSLAQEVTLLLDLLSLLDGVEAVLVVLRRDIMGLSERLPSVGKINTNYYKL